MTLLIRYIKVFLIPVLVLAGLLLYGVLFFIGNFSLLPAVSLITILLGSYKLILETYEDVVHKQLGLDYIAIIAVVVSVATHEYIVGMILALMIASGRNLEEYGASKAKGSLTELSSRIPHDITVLENSHHVKKPVKNVTVNEIIMVRKGEVVPLDGILTSSDGVFDEQSLTGEAFPINKYRGDMVRSGIINLGAVVEIKVVKEEKDSSYSKIVELVTRAQSAKAPLVRLADKYSIYFTLVTFVIALFAFFFHGTLESILAVLVVATPCPLILATPIALLGGMNAQAKKRIIIKQLSSLETLARVDTIVFDKTGTITLGKPRVIEIKVNDPEYSKEKVTSIFVAIERNSLHPLASAVIAFGKHAKPLPATNIKEILGKGIEGTVEGTSYTIKRTQTQSSDMEIGLYKGNFLISTIVLEDEVKAESREVIRQLKNIHMNIMIFTGDKLETAKHLVANLGLAIEIKAEQKPEDKQNGIEKLKKGGATVAMVGDGINDAPALALADVGIVFASEEKTAASEAADIVLLGGGFSSVLFSILSAKRTIKIAKQSIIVGIGLSTIFMVGAAFGLIPPLIGAVLQEGIDVAVILNALRAASSGKFNGNMV